MKEETLFLFPMPSVVRDLRSYFEAGDAFPFAFSNARLYSMHIELLSSFTLTSAWRRR